MVQEVRDQEASDCGGARRIVRKTDPITSSVGLWMETDHNIIALEIYPGDQLLDESMLASKWRR